MLHDILKALRKSANRSSADLRADLARIDLQAIERRVAEAEAQRRLLLVHGTDEELRSADEDLIAANLEAERAQAAADELKALISEAEGRERLAEVDAKAGAAKRLQQNIVAAMIEFDTLAMQIAAKRAEIETGERQLEAANVFLSDRGRGDLRVSTPRQELDARGVSQADMPRTAEWKMPGYFVPPGIQSSGRRPFGLVRQLLDEVRNA